MEATAEPTFRYSRWLPYWAVLQTDVRQTLRSWVYRVWVLMSVLGAIGYLLYKIGVHREAGMTQFASLQTEHLLRGLVVAGLALIALIAVSSVSSERNTVADSILSRGISRYQYFLAKWHARMAVIVGTFIGIAGVVLGAHHFFFDSDLSLTGGVLATLLVALILAVVVSWGVTVGALSSSTVMGITLFWLIIYGGILILSLLPEPYPTPDRLFARLHLVLQGQYETATLIWLAGISTLLVLGAAGVGLVVFSRKDV